MIVSPVFAGKKYAVLGLARSGRATVDALLASGAEVVAWDEKAEARMMCPREGGGPESPVEGLGPRLRGGTLGIADPLTLDLTGFAGVVVSPGVPLNRHPIAAHAAKHGVPVIGDIELFAQARADLPPHTVVGITGTNGKSTTTALVHHILKTAGVPTTMGGNIGLPILAQDPLPEGGVYVLELSSYQIDLTQSLDCDVAVLLNITPDHLDRYASFEAYAASKMRLFEMQSGDHAAVGEPGAPEFDEIYKLRGSCARSYLNTPPVDELAKSHLWPALPGPHNLSNATAALVSCNLLGIDEGTIKEGLRTYPGLPHRMEYVGEVAGVHFVNDSKATNPESTAPALTAYPAIRWILGGRAKTPDLDACLPYLSHVRSAYTIGEAGPGYAQILAAHMPVTECGVLAEAVKRAADDAEAGDVVLLSPACASFDQFRDFEARGEAFRAAVGAL